MSLESLCTIPFQARASNVKMPKLKQHSLNYGMIGFVNIFGTSQGTWDQFDKSLDSFGSSAADILRI